MSLAKFVEEGNIFSYAILSSKVSQVLKAMRSGKDIDERDKDVLNRGLKLIEAIREGALLIERNTKIKGLSPTQESVFVYDYALSAYCKIENNFKPPLSDFFSQLSDYIKKSSNGIHRAKAPKIDLDFMINFFNVLSDSFTKELQKDNYLPLYESYF